MNHIVTDSMSLLDHDGPNTNSLVQVDLDSINQHGAEYLSLAAHAVEDVRVTGSGHTGLSQSIGGITVQANANETITTDDGAANGSTFVLLDLAPEGDNQRLNTFLLTSEDGESMLEIHLDKLNSELQSGEGLVLLSDSGTGGQTVEISNDGVLGRLNGGVNSGCGTTVVGDIPENCTFEALTVPAVQAAQEYQLQSINVPGFVDNKPQAMILHQNQLINTNSGQTYKLLPYSDAVSLTPAITNVTAVEQSQVAGDIATESSRRMQTLVDNLLVKVEKPSEEMPFRLQASQLGGHTYNGHDQQRILLDTRKFSNDFIIKPDSLPVPPFRCNKCDFVENVSYRKFKRHQKVHESDKKFKCGTCMASFNQEINLLIHKASDHDYKPPGSTYSTARHVCPVCQKEFSRNSSYKGHLQAHCIDEEVNCTICGATFSDRESLTIHMEQHVHNPVPIPPPVHCTQCGLRLPSLGAIRKHYTAAHPEMRRRGGGFIIQPASEEISNTEVISETNEISPENSAEEQPKARKTRVCKSRAADILSKVTRGQLLVVGGEKKTDEAVTIDIKRKGRGRPRLNKNKSNGKSKVIEDNDPTQLAPLAETLANTPSLKCVYCSKQFKKRSLLRRHLVVHTKERPHVCRTCGRGFTQNTSLKIHERQHNKSKPYVCDKCGDSFSQKGNLKSHIAKIHENSQKTQTEPPKLKPSPAMSIPMYQCGDCDVVANTVEEIRLHMVQQHSVPEGTTTSFVKQLEDTFIDGINYVEGVKSLADNVVISSHVEAKHEVDLDADTKNVDLVLGPNTQFYLDQCQRERPEEEEANQSSKPMHELVDRVTGRRILHYVKKSNDGKRKLLVCQVCFREFKKSVDLVRHNRLHTRERPFQCSQCRKQFRLKSVLQSHLRTHQGMKAFQCHYCNKCFTMSQSLRVHMRLHTGHQPYACHLCPMRFATSSHRNYHVRTHPDRDFRQLSRTVLGSSSGQKTTTVQNEDVALRRTHQCEYCPSAYKMENHLRAHVRQRHLGQSKEVACPQCGKTFVNQYSYRQHVSARHLRLKPHQCSQCSATFTTKSSLSRHKLAHSSIRPHTCRVCRRVFKTAEACRRHMKSHTRDSVTQVTSSANDVDVEQPPSPALLPQQQQQAHQSAKPIQQVETQAVAVPQQIQSAVPQSNFEQPGNEPNLEQVLHSLMNVPSPPPTSTFVLQPTSSTAPNANLFPAAQPAQTFTYVTSDDQTVSFGPESLLNVLEAHIICDGAQDPTQTLYATPADPNSGQVAQQGDTIMYSQLAYNQCVNIDGGTTLILTTAPPEAPKPPPPPITHSESEPGFGALNEDLQKKETSVNTQTVLPEPLYYGCSDCSASYNNAAELTSHVKEVHAIPKMHRCSFCLKFFSSWLVLTVHMRAHANTGEGQDELDTMMELCEEEYRAPNSDNNNLRCPACHTNFPSQASLSRHVTMVHTKTAMPYICRHCGTIYRTIRELRAHVVEVLEDRQTVRMNMKSGKKNNSQRLTYAKAVQHRLKLDEAQTTQIAELSPNSHMTVSEKYLIEVAKERNVISLPGENPRNSLVQLPHQLGHRYYLSSFVHRYPCAICKRAFRRPSDLQRHLLTHTGEKPFSCSKCPRAFSTKQSLKIHQRRHAAECKLFVCHVCGVMCSSKSSLKVHMRIHTGTKPYGCNECGMRFRIPSQRIKHFADAHEKSYPAGRGKKNAVIVREDEPAKKLTVENINQESMRNETLEIMAETAPPEKMANETGKTTELEAQEIMSSDEAVVKSLLVGSFITRGWRCTQCGENFMDNGMYQAHACVSNQTGSTRERNNKSDAATETGDKSRGDADDTTCEVCGKAFSRPSLLQRHRRIHTGERPFRCEICDRSFNQECAMRTHTLRHTDERPHQCPICNLRFSQRGNMLGHIIRMHPQATENETRPVVLAEER